MTRIIIIFALLAGAGACVTAGPQQAAKMEMQLAGIQLGKPAATVLKAYGNPRRILVGAVTPGGTQAPGAQPAAPVGPPMMPGMMPGGIEEEEGERGSPPGGFGGNAPAPGLPAGPYLAPAAAPKAPSAVQIIQWIYELDREGVIYIFGIDEMGEVISITVGDGWPDSINRGGVRVPRTPARTLRGIRLGDSFRKLLKVYGYPETQQNVGGELVMTYYDKCGIAFSLKPGVMRITSITVRQVSSND